MSCDPIGEEGGLNLYGMVNNNLIGNWDRLGLKKSWTIKGEVIDGPLIRWNYIFFATFYTSTKRIRYHVKIQVKPSSGEVAKQVRKSIRSWQQLLTSEMDGWKLSSEKGGSDIDLVFQVKFFTGFGSEGFYQVDALSVPAGEPNNENDMTNWNLKKLKQKTIPHEIMYMFGVEDDYKASYYPNKTTDLTSIMGNPSTGIVKKKHIEQIVFKRDNVNRKGLLPCPNYTVEKED